MNTFILAIDQGTTSSRAMVFDDNQAIVAVDQKEFTQYFPASGMVEHDIDEIWQSIIEVCRNAIAKAGIEPNQLAAIGITNQRETTVVWDKTTGSPIHPAIVWQDRRTASFCSALKQDGQEAMVRQKTGLLLDPYFSATKLKWILDKVDGAREAAQSGNLLFGTVDTYLLWKLTDGAAHKTDATNASRTLLFNIHENCWDEALCNLFDVPMAMLPDVEDCASEFGYTSKHWFGASIPILGIAGDQHAATLGQACFKPGMVKSTYGTGCFAMLNTGDTSVSSSNRLLSTIAYRLNGKTTYALEGSIFIAGAAVQWLRDGLGIIQTAEETGALAEVSDNNQNVILVPAFAGLGAPYWKPDARGAIFGLTRNSGPADFAKAALEAVCFQTRDLIEAMVKDFDVDIAVSGLKVDGGMVVSDWTMQSLADTLQCAIHRPIVSETTALGAAWLAGMKAGVWPDQEAFSRAWQLERQFIPDMNSAYQNARYEAWKSAVEATIKQSSSIYNETT